MSVLTLVTGKEDRTLRRIRVSDIARNPNQPRKYFDPEAIAQLAESIRQMCIRDRVYTELSTAMYKIKHRNTDALLYFTGPSGQKRRIVRHAFFV